MQRDLAGNWLTSFKEVEIWLQTWVTSKDEKFFFRDGIRKLPERWENVVTNDGRYFD